MLKNITNKVSSFSSAFFTYPDIITVKDRLQDYHLIHDIVEENFKNVINFNDVNSDEQLYILTRQCRDLMYFLIARNLLEKRGIETSTKSTILAGEEVSEFNDPIKARFETLKNNPEVAFNIINELGKERPKKHDSFLLIFAREKQIALGNIRFLFTGDPKFLNIGIKELFKMSLYSRRLEQAKKLVADLYHEMAFAGLICLSASQLFNALLSKRPELVNLENTCFRSTLLHMAIDMGKLDFVDVLIKNKVDINKNLLSDESLEEQYIETPIELAITAAARSKRFDEYQKIITLLLENGADPDLLGVHGSARRQSEIQYDEANDQLKKCLDLVLQWQEPKPNNEFRV